MRWQALTSNVSSFRPSNLRVAERGGYELYHNPLTGKGWILERRSNEWFIYGPYKYEHVRTRYNAL